MKDTHTSPISAPLTKYHTKSHLFSQTSFRQGNKFSSVPQLAHSTLVLFLVKPHLTHYRTTFVWLMFCSPYWLVREVSVLQHLCYVFFIFCFFLCCVQSGRVALCSVVFISRRVSTLNMLLLSLESVCVSFIIQTLRKPYTNYKI